MKRQCLWQQAHTTAVNIQRTARFKASLTSCSAKCPCRCLLLTSIADVYEVGPFLPVRHSMLVHELHPASKPQHNLAHLKNSRCQIMSNGSLKNTLVSSCSQQYAECTQQVIKKRDEDDANFFTEQSRARDSWLEEQRREWMCSDTPSEPQQHEQPVQLETQHAVARTSSGE